MLKYLESLKNFGKKNKKENDNELSNTYQIDNSGFVPAPPDSKDDNVKEETEIKQEEKWIWVKGYKGTNGNMCCTPGNIKFQYKLHNKYKCDEDVELCAKGFHFCEDLKDVFNYYRLDFHNRYFEVEGLVKEKDYINMENTKGQCSFVYPSMYITDSKLVAKELYLLNELTYNDLSKFIKEKYPMIRNEEDYNICKETTYDLFLSKKFCNEMTNLGFSKLFTKIIYNDLQNISPSKLYDYLQQARAYKEEKVSKDIMIYLLEQYKNKLIREQTT